MKWHFFEKSKKSLLDGHTLLFSVATMLEHFREENGQVVMNGSWVDREAGVYVIEIVDPIICFVFDSFLDNNPEYDHWREEPIFEGMSFKS